MTWPIQKARFATLEHIRKGSLGGVFPGIDNCTQQVVAINITDLEEAEDGTEDFWQEITILSWCDSSYVKKTKTKTKTKKLWIVFKGFKITDNNGIPGWWGVSTGSSSSWAI